MSSQDSIKEWIPSRFTIGDNPKLQRGKHAFIVVISNQPLENKDLLLKVCHEAYKVVCADGGANRLKDLGLDDLEETECALNMICGDMDSARPEVIEYYAQKGVSICKDTDQYSTDLMKCLKFVHQTLEHTMTPAAKFSCKHGIDVVLLGGLGGRADQAFSQLHHLHTIPSLDFCAWVKDVYLITAESLVFLLEKGANKIHVPVKEKTFTENVGIIPIGKPSIITTQGLEWDVTDWPTEFGGQMSTSNHIKAEVVEISTTERVLVTLEYHQHIRESEIGGDR